MKSETVLTRFSHSSTLKFTALFYLEWIIPPFLIFATLCTGHMKNISSLNYANLPNVNSFHFTISKKIHIFYYHLKFHQKICIRMLSSSLLLV